VIHNGACFIVTGQQRGNTRVSYELQTNMLLERFPSTPVERFSLLFRLRSHCIVSCGKAEGSNDFRNPESARRFRQRREQTPHKNCEIRDESLSSVSSDFAM
jgi:hypothetical protein